MKRDRSVKWSTVGVFCCLIAGAALAVAAIPGEAGAGTGSVKRIRTVKRYGKSLDWSHEKDLIASSRRGLDGYYDVFVMRPDGSEETNLTSGRPGCPQKHNGNPAWHPSGGYIVFTAQKEDAPPAVREWAIPGTGFCCDLWLMTSDGKSFYQLTDYPLGKPVRGVIHPQFSHDGTKLFWAERVSRGTSFGGGWVLKTADFELEGNAPRLENVKTIEPGDRSCFCESHAFSGDDGKVLFSGNLLAAQPDTGLDIWELDLETEELKRLTDSFEDWDEHAHYSPDGSSIAWMSSSGFDIEYGSTKGHDWADYLTTELWLMDADGSNRERLTFFNEPGHPEYMGGRRCVVSDSAWSPDGERIVALVASETQRGRLRCRIVMIELEDSGE